MFVGGVLGMLGIATIATFTLVPGSSENTFEFATLPQPFTPHSSGSALLTGTPTGSGGLTISWRASAPLTVTLFPATGCGSPAPSCATGSAVASWAQAPGGNWSTSGKLSFPYLIAWNEPANLTGNVTVAGVETMQVRVAPSVLTELVIDGAGAALAVIGAVAVFLGLFLRGGVYRGPPPVVSRSADDVEEVARTGPGTPPPRG